MHFCCAGTLARMRRLLLLVSAIIFVDALLFTALTPLLPAYAEEFDLSKAGAGLPRRRVRRRRAARRHPGWPGCGTLRAEASSRRGLLLLSVSSFAFAAADSALALGGARFIQGIASTATWAGALAWISVTAPSERRGEVIGTAFGAAIFGAVLGPAFGGLADFAGIGLAFTTVGAVTWASRRSHRSHAGGPRGRVAGWASAGVP